MTDSNTSHGYERCDLCGYSVFKFESEEFTPMNVCVLGSRDKKSFVAGEGWRIITNGGSCPLAHPNEQPLNDNGSVSAPNPHFGSSLEDFLAAEGLLEEATEHAIKALSSGDQ